MNGPTIRRFADGKMRPTSKLPKLSRRWSIIESSIQVTYGLQRSLQMC